MTESPANFVEQWLSGQVIAEAIYEFIDRWHESDEAVPLPQYLGMTPDEYALWLEKPESLPVILSAHRKRRPVEKAARMDQDTRRNE